MRWHGTIKPEHQRPWGCCLFPAWPSYRRKCTQTILNIKRVRPCFGAKMALHPPLHTSSLSIINEKEFFFSPPHVKHLANRNWRNVIPTSLCWCCPSNTFLPLTDLLLTPPTQLFSALFSLFVFIFHLCIMLDTQRIPVLLGPAQLRSHPPRFQYSFHCPALYDSLSLPGGLLVCTLFRPWIKAQLLASSHQPDYSSLGRL